MEGIVNVESVSARVKVLVVGVYLWMAETLAWKVEVASLSLAKARPFTTLRATLL